MPIVFIHGVNVRKDDKYDQREQLRNRFLREYLLSNLVADPDKATILSPFWGDLGGHPKWDNASLPGKENNVLEGFGTDDDEDAHIKDLLSELGIDMPEQPDTLLLTIAKEKSLVEAVDFLIAVSEQEDEADAAAIASLSQQLVDYAEANPHPSWLHEVALDGAFVTRLESEASASDPSSDAGMGALESLSSFSRGWDSLRENLSRITSAVGDTTSAIVLKHTRNAAHKQVTGFLGDILVYLKQRGDKTAPGEIVVRITDALDEAFRHRSADDNQLIVIAHSMGGNIAYDVFSHFLPDLEIDVFITVGSQPGFFEELKQFKSSDLSIPNDAQQLVPKLPNVKRWINIFDTNDILSFVTADIFEGTEDLLYNTGSSVAGAHTTYFNRPTFYKRLSKRLLA